MNLNKITTDAWTFYAKTHVFEEMTNTIIYMSYSNYVKLKELIRNGINNAKTNELKEIEKKFMTYSINFINANDMKLKDNFLQSDPLVFIEERKVYISIQKDVKKIFQGEESDKNEYLTEEENDTLYTAILESTELLTINTGLLETISDLEIPVFSIDIMNQ